MVGDVRNTFKGCLNRVSMSVCRLVVGGRLEVFFPSERNESLKRGPCILLSVTLTCAHVLNWLLRCGVMMFVYVCGASCVDYIFGRPCSK